MDNIDQRITQKLQQIDVDFVECHDLTYNVLKKVREYKHNINRIHTGLHVWQQFFDGFTLSTISMESNPGIDKSSTSTSTTTTTNAPSIPYNTFKTPAAAPAHQTSTRHRMHGENDCDEAPALPTPPMTQHKGVGSISNLSYTTTPSITGDISVQRLLLHHNHNLDDEPSLPLPPMTTPFLAKSSGSNSIHDRDDSLFFTPAIGNNNDMFGELDMVPNDDDMMHSSPFNTISEGVEMSLIKHAAEPENDLSMLHIDLSTTSLHPLTPGPPPIITSALQHSLLSGSKESIRTPLAVRVSSVSSGGEQGIAQGSYYNTTTTNTAAVTPTLTPLLLSKTSPITPAFNLVMNSENIISNNHQKASPCTPGLLPAPPGGVMTHTPLPAGSSGCIEEQQELSFDLTLLPRVFQTGDGAYKITSLYEVLIDNGNPMSMNELQKLLPEVGSEMMQVLLTTLVSRNLVICTRTSDGRNSMWTVA